MAATVCWCGYWCFSGSDVAQVVARVAVVMDTFRSCSCQYRTDLGKSTHLYDETQGTVEHLTKAIFCRKRLCFTVPCVPSYRRVHFPRPVLFCQPHQQLFTHSLPVFLDSSFKTLQSCYNARNPKQHFNRYICLCRTYFSGPPR